MSKNKFTVAIIGVGGRGGYAYGRINPKNFKRGGGQRTL